ncbi:MAG: prepilin-type N-terminal cleavage/methylation domain-containing protein [Candidatus Omnitrophica bacterium]|nr:prepilin-type N-terminal cleavage/methylation domain-containing protein [Candidatus Omnitrophota bacterium]
MADPERTYLKNENGFTVIELLIVIIVIGVLAGLALYSTTGTIEKVRSKDAYYVIRSIKSAEELYLSENGSFDDFTGPSDCDLSLTIPADNSTWYNYSASGVYDTLNKYNEILITASRSSKNCPSGKQGLTISLTFKLYDDGHSQETWSGTYTEFIPAE